MLVRIHATTVTQGDVVLRAMPSLLARPFGIRGKRMLGHEYAGVVAAVGDAESHYRPGDRVFGTTTGLVAGAYPEAICVPGDGHRRDPERAPVRGGRPDPDRFADGVDPPATRGRRRGRRTANPRLRRVRKRGQIRSAVGVAFGGRVTGVSSTANLDLVSRWRERVIDDTREDVLAIPERFDGSSTRVARARGVVSRGCSPQGVGSYRSARARPSTWPTSGTSATCSRLARCARWSIGPTRSRPFARPTSTSSRATRRATS